MIKRLAIAIVLVLVVSGGLIGFNLFRDQKIAEFFETMPPQVATVSAMEVERSRWEPGIETVGTATAAQGIELTAQVAGNVESIRFDSNQQVAQGEVLITLQDDIESAELPGAEAAVSTAEAALDRQRELRRRGVVAESVFETAANEVAAARARLARLQAVIDQKVIEAPFAGTVGLPQVDPGQYVQPGTPLATLQDLDTIHVDFTVPEQRAAELSMGQSVLIGGTEGSATFDGRIIGIEPRVDPASRLVTARAAVSNPGGGLRPGQFVEVRVQLPAEEGVIALPQTAVVTSLYGDYVYALSPAPDAPRPEGAPPRFEARQQFVQTGRRFGGFVEVTEGLDAGRMVVTAGQNKLQNGSLVSLDDTVDPADLAEAGDARP